MTLDLTGILCSVTVLNPLIREGALAFLFARTNTSFLPAKVTSLPKWDARYSSFVFCQAFTNAGLHIPYVPLPFARHSFSSHTKHSRFFHGRLTPTTELLCEHWEQTTWWALQVPLLREQKEIWSLKKITQLARDQVRCMHNRGSSPKLCLSSNRTGGTNLQQPGNHGHGSTQQRAFLALSLHSHTLSASALKPK